MLYLFAQSSEHFMCLQVQAKGTIKRVRSELRPHYIGGPTLKSDESDLLKSPEILLLLTA
jgi:hypothetical protein